MAYFGYLIKRLGIRIVNQFGLLFLIALLLTLTIAAIYFRKQLMVLIKEYNQKLKTKKPKPKKKPVEEVQEVQVIKIEAPPMPTAKKPEVSFYNKTVKAIKMFFYNLLVKKVFAKTYTKEVKLTEKGAMKEIRELKTLIKRQREVYQSRQMAKEEKRKEVFDVFEGQKKKKESKTPKQTKIEPVKTVKQPKKKRQPKQDVFEKLKKVSKASRTKGDEFKKLSKIIKKKAKK